MNSRFSPSAGGQPVNGDFRLDGFEFGVAGHQAGAILFG